MAISPHIASIACVLYHIFLTNNSCWQHTFLTNLSVAHNPLLEQGGEDAGDAGEALGVGVRRDAARGG